MLNTVHVQNSGEVGGAAGNGAFASPNDVPEGVIAFFNVGGTASIDISDTTNNKIEAQGDIQIVLGTSGDPRITNILDASELKISSLAYTAPAKQVTEVDIGTVAEDTMLTLKLVSIEEGYEPRPRHSVEVEALASDTADDIVNKFITAINSVEGGINGHEGPSVVPTLSASKLVLTASNDGDIFEVGFQGTDVTVSTTTPPTPGSGTGAQVREMERRVRGILGRYVQDDPLLGSQPQPELFAEEGTGYHLITLRQETQYDQAINKSARFQDVVIALASDMDATNVNSFFGNQGVSL